MNRTPALPPLSRRALLGLGTLGLATGAATLWPAPSARATSGGTVLPLVDPLPAGAPDRSLFAPHEQVFASYLMIVAPLANSVRDLDPNYGWMEDGWWRTPNDPLNSRIMEHVATLAWFLTHERDWNPYYLDERLEARLDAALGYYLSLQGPRGAWPVTYESESLATTGFGLVSLSLTYRDLASHDLLADRRTEMATAMRAAADWLMDLSYDHWAVPLRVHNQLVGGLAGVGHAATVLEDPAIAADLADRTAYLIEHGQAPAGYFHEPLGFDHGYNFTVALPDLGDLYQQTGDPALVEHVSRWADFAQYVLLPEPGLPGYVTFGAASMRNSTSTMTITAADDADRAALGRAFLPEVPLLAAFHAPAEDKAASRAAWAASTDPVRPRAKGDTSPRLYAHVPNAPDNLGQSGREAIIASLRPVAEDAFTEYREGTIDQQLLFVRRPGYYLATLLGHRGSTRTRSGPGMLWHPTAGSVIASFNNAADDHWTTMTASGLDVALTDLVATFHDGTDASAPTIDPDELAQITGAFTGHYVAADGAVTTDVTHLHDAVVRAVSVAESSTEMVPLLLKDGDVLELSDGTTGTPGTALSTTATWFAVTRGSIRVQVSWGEALAASLAPTSRVYLGALRHHVLAIEHSGMITVEVTTIDLGEMPARVPFSVTSHSVLRAGAWHTVVHAVNLDTEPIDLRVVTAAGTRTFREVAPGQGAIGTFRNDRLVPAPGVAVATTCGPGRPRVATQTFDL